MSGGRSYDWEQRKLSSIVSRVKSYSLSRDVETKEYTGYKYIHYGDIHTKIANIIDKSSNLPNINIGNYDLLRKGDIVLADASEDYQGIATPAVITINPPYKLVSGLHTIALRPKQIDSLFLYYFIHSSTFRKFGYKMGTGMKVFGISVTNLLKFKGTFPKLEEQKKVGEFFKKLDDTLALHQEKLMALERLKKVFTQVIFPQKGENVPRLRFADFHDKWKQRKLRDISEIVGGGTPSTSNPEYWNGDIDWYSPTEIGDCIYTNGSVKTITQLGLEKSSAKILPSDKTVLFTSRAGIGNMAILQHPGATNQGFQSLVLNDDIDTYFIYSMEDLIKKYALKNASGSTFLEISGKTLGDMPILIPSTNEQIQIGTLFKNIDNLIILHKKKIKKLQLLKKAYLQKMFI